MCPVVLLTSFCVHKTSTVCKIYEIFSEMSELKRIRINGFQKLARLWRQLLGLAIPILLLPLLFIGEDDIREENELPNSSTKFKAAYTILVIALYWMFEVMPLAVTSLIPLVLFPFLGVLSTKKVALVYFKETNAMFFGGLVLALSVEYCNLHRRIALKVMTIVGSEPIKLLFGVMSTCMFLSMWMSNTACTAMMLPILIAVLNEISGAQTDISPANMHKMFMFGVAYASSLGGSSTLTGTGPNLVFSAEIKKVDVSQDNKYLDMTFANWMALNVPAAVLNTFVAFVYLVSVFIGLPNCRKWPIISWLFYKASSKNAESLEEIDIEALSKIKNADIIIQAEYRKLGPMNFHEIGVATIFSSVIFLWMFRDPKFISGWNSFFEPTEIGDSTVAILGIIFMFVLPKNLSFFTCPKEGQEYEALLDWKFVQKNLSWGLVLLLGGGFAISEGAEKSGLSKWIGSQMTGLEGLPPSVILFVVMISTAGLTEVCSNVATANVLLPILLQLSKSINLHPLYLTVPATISCSFAFMLPVSTPPNALIFSTGHLRITDMVKTGAFLNIACIMVYYLVHVTLGDLMFNYSDYSYPVPSNDTM